MGSSAHADQKRDNCSNWKQAKCKQNIQFFQEDSLINIKKLKGLDIQTHFIQLQDKDPSDLGFENILPLLKKEDKPMSFQDEMKMRLGF